VLVRRRTFLALVGPLPLLLVTVWRPGWFCAGAAVSLAGALLRVWAAGCLVKDEALCDGGPYALVRNPLYLGSLLALVGYCIMSGQWWTPLVWVPLFALSYVPTIASEERALAERFGEAYGRYAARAPALFPGLCRAAPAQPVKFSLRQSLGRNREYQALLGTLAMVGLFAAVGLLRQ
jgi:protein-S-isoprenylcysteine O-methyltransferase Ste14